MSDNRSRVWIALGILAVLCLQLGVRGLNEPDEGRMGSLAYEMYANHDWLTPRIYDHAHFNKPPLAYWLMIVGFHVGGVNEWMARLPSALAAWGTVLLAIQLAGRIFGKSKGLTAGLVLLTCPLFFAMSQIIDYNMQLTFWVTLAISSAVAWQQDGKPVQRFMFYVAIALGFLTKGPVILAIVLLALAGFRWPGDATRAWRPLWSWPLVLACTAVSLSWFVIVASIHPELWRYFLLGELYNRVFTTEHHRSEPIYYYLWMFPAAILPWLWPAVMSLKGFSKIWKTDSNIRLLVAWIALPLIMFTCSKSKMPTYILPLLPAAAVLAAGQLRVNAKLFGLATGVLLVGYHVFLAGAFLRETQIKSHSTTRELARVILQESAPGDRIALLEKNPRGLSFYVKRPISVPLSKFEFQIDSDRARVADKDFDDPAVPFAWFDSTQHVFFVCSIRVAEERERDARNKPRTIYSASKMVLISNR